MGPHHRGKNGSSGRTCWAGTLGSARLRPGTGDLDWSDSAMDAQGTHVFLFNVDAFWSLKTDCDAKGLGSSTTGVFPRDSQKEQEEKANKQNQTWRHEKKERKQERNNDTGEKPD